MTSRKLLYFLTEDWFFCSHFIDRARAARQAGYEVAVAAREGKDGDFIRSAGFKYFQSVDRTSPPCPDVADLLAVQA